MGKRFAKIVLKTWKWKYNNFPDVKKAVVIMAPHTSIFDFVWGKIYFMANDIKPKVLIKKECFFFPLGNILSYMGGLPVKRGKISTNITETAIENFKSNKDSFLLLITPEGTRKKTKYWKKGFIRIANTSNVPIVLGYIDYSRRQMGVIDIINVNKDISIEENMENIKKIYMAFSKGGLRKNKFATGYE